MSEKLLKQTITNKTHENDFDLIYTNMNIHFIYIYVYIYICMYVCIFHFILS